MLALEVVLAGADPVPTFVFDEVDAGVGGRAAVEIGRRLARLARSAQVVVVTHLPQVAAYADRHLVVVKSDDGAVTESGVRTLDDAERVAELARMLAGQEESRDGPGPRPGAARGGPGRRRRDQPASTVLSPARGRMAPMRRLSLRSRAQASSAEGVVGVARVDGRTKNLTKRLQPGDIAVIDHLDIDTVAAEALVARRPAAVVNAASSTSGRYPNLGPEILLGAGRPAGRRRGPRRHGRRAGG